MTSTELPDSSYTRTWTGGRGEVRNFSRGHGSRLRYYTTGIEPRPVMRAVLHGGFFDNAALPADLLDELRKARCAVSTE